MKQNFPFTPRVLRKLSGLALLTASAGVAQAQTFGTSTTFSAGASPGPTGMRLADVNGDGKLDAIVVNGNSQSISVFTGNGTGGFTPGSSFSNGSTSQFLDVAVGDVNGDGKLDALTANNNTDNIGILLGNGAGSFALQNTLPSTGSLTRPFKIMVADVNGDRKLDILTANYGDGAANNCTLGVLLGNGAGGFTSQPLTSTGAQSRPTGLAVADVNGDGKLDVLTANYNSSTLGVLLGNGAGGFTLQANSPSTGTNSGPYDVVIADANGDGKLDALTANRGSGTLGVLLGNGLGGFALQTNAPTAGAGSGPLSLAVADVNKDGKLDALTANFNTGTLGVLLGDGTGNFSLEANSPATGTISSTGTITGRPYAIGIADVNGDGKLDAVAANGSNSNTVGVLLNTLASPPTTINTSRCGSGTVLLQASGATTGSTYRWYTMATGGTAISGATSSSYTTPTLYGTTTYYVSIVSASGSETTRTAITATINYSLPPTITASGPTTFNGGGSVMLTARPNLALQFDGNSQYVSTTLDAQPSALPTTTWEAWVYPTRANYGTRQTLMGIDDGAWDRGVIIEANTTNFAVFTGTSTIWQPTTVDFNTWQHIAVVYTPTGITFYKNGVAYTYDTSQGYTQGASVNKLNIGRNPGFGEYFQGQLDEVRVWNYQRTQAQLQAGMFAMPAGTSSGLVGSWSLNEGSGTTAADATGTYPGTLVSTPAYVTPGQTSLNTTYAWTPSAGLSSPTAQTVTAAPTTTTTYTVAVSDNGGCAPTASQTVTVYADLVITTANQTIPAGVYNSITVLSGGSGTLSGNVTVNSSVNVQSGGMLNDGGNLIGGTGSFTLQAGGALGIGHANGIAATGSTGAVQTTGTRSFSPNASYVYNGTAAQTTGSGLPSQIRSLTTTNANTVTLSAPVSVAQTLTVGGAGNLQLNGQALTLLSSAGGTALVVNSGTGAVLGNTATVQRYLDPSCYNGPGYRHYSAPVSGSTVSDLATTTGFTPVINPAYNGSATPGQVTPFPTVFGYDQSLLSTSTSNYSAFDKGFFSPSALSEQLAVGKGYAVQLDAAQLVDFTGQLNTGDQPLTLSRNTDATAPDAGWALVGNPYPAPLDWSQVAPADRTGLDGSIYVVQSSGPYTGSYRTYVNNLSTSVSNDPLIGMGQGFFVRVSAGQSSGTLTFRNSQRVTSYGTQVAVQRTAADLRPLVRLSLRTGAGQADGLVVYAEAGATASFDASYDAGKFINSTGLNLASLSAANEPLAIDGRPAFTAATVVPLTVGVPAAGTYALAAATIKNLPAGLDAYLTDTKTGQTIQLSQQAGYSFSVTAAEATTLLTGRFTLRFGSVTALATTAALSASEVSLYPNPAHASFAVRLPSVAGTSQVQATLFNALGQVVRQQRAALPATGATLSVDTQGLPTGVYTLRLQAGATTLAKRVILN